MTTSTFSAEARDYVKRIEKKVVLVDASQLAGYMFDFSIGVNPVSSFEIKRADGNFSEDWVSVARPESGRRETKEAGRQKTA